VPSEQFGFTVYGLPVPGPAEENLCVKAYRKLKERFDSIGQVRIFLYKNIPMGAGLGGGSSDAAFLLRLLGRMFALSLTNQEENKMALELGSDCPFFLHNKPCLASGRGEQLDPVGLDLSEYRFILVHPGISISTREAFAAVKPKQPARSIGDIIREPVSKWRGTLINDFEESAVTKYPELGGVREELYRAGAIYASMTGSGSSLYGIFEKTSQPNFQFNGNYRVDYF
jgi:4-diphosphocytidyl-2-C-methyl-D-erythritol kinase